MLNFSYLYVTNIFYVATKIFAIFQSFSAIK